MFQQYIDILFNFPGKALINQFDVRTIVELFIILLILFIGYKKFIKGTQSENLLKGFVIILSTLLISKLLIILKLEILGKFLESLVNIIIFGLVVIFQPELRRFLGYIGQPGLFSKNFFNKDKKKPEVDIVNEITDAIKYFSKSHIGALIVIERSSGVDSYPEVGTNLDAIVTTELLLTIFHPNTALHDGAVVIRDNKISAAGVLLPLTEDPKLSWRYGTRHRAAIGMSEVSDAVCLVVSEETGNISIAQNGNLMQFESTESLKITLNDIFNSIGVKTNVDKQAKTFKINPYYQSDATKQTKSDGNK